MKAIAAFGWLTAAFGACASLLALFSPGQTGGEIAIRFAFSAGLGLAGVVMARRAGRVAAHLDPQEAERQILRTARAHRGRVTASEVAAETPVPLAQASEMLEAFSRRGFCRMSVAETGILVFEFPELEQPAPEPAEREGDDTAARAAAARAQRTSE